MKAAVWMYQFFDKNGCEVRLTFGPPTFSNKAKHVWVICRFEGKWLLTKHKRRGLEFPGGKVEQGELLEEAAVREVWEETGAKVNQLYYVGQYEVKCFNDRMVKTIYYAEIETLLPKEHYFETNGPMLMVDFPANICHDSAFSFVMQDEVLIYSIEEIKRKWL